MVAEPKAGPQSGGRAVPDRNHACSADSVCVDGLITGRASKRSCPTYFSSEIGLCTRPCSSHSDRTGLSFSRANSG